jgi:hypothetical protein
MTGRPNAPATPAIGSVEEAHRAPNEATILCEAPVNDTQVSSQGKGKEQHDE